MKDIDLKDRLRFQKLLKIVRDNDKGTALFFATLIEIKHEELYKVAYPTWAKFIEENCRHTVRWVDKVIAKMTVRKMLAETTGEEVDEKTSKTTDSEQPSTADTDGLEDEPKSSEPEKPTPPPAKPKPVYDNEGNELKFDARKFWARREEIMDVLKEYNLYKARLLERIDRHDPLWHGIMFNRLEDALDEATSLIRGIIPHAVCTECYGAPSTRGGTCGFCGKRGLITKHQWEVMVSQEKKAIMAKTARGPK